MDRSINNQETQKYGPDLRANVARAFAGLTGTEKAMVQWMIIGQRAVDESMADAMHAARKGTSESTSAADAKAPVVVAARRLLVGLAKHLDAKTDLDEWEGDEALFFPEGRSGLSSYAIPLLESVTIAVKALKDDPSVPDHATFAVKLKKAHGDLTAHIDATGNATADARGGLSEQSVEKKAWLREYRGNVLVIEGLLQKLGRSNELHAIVLHLSTPGTRKAAAAAAKA